MTSNIPEIFWWLGLAFLVTVIVAGFRWRLRIYNRIIGLRIPVIGRRIVPSHVHEEDRRTWPTAELLWETDVTDSQKQWLAYPPYHDPTELILEKGVMKFHVKPQTDDEWAYVYLDPTRHNWSDISWQMMFRRLTHFQEYAFNFRYVDFDNRYRYRFEDDYLFFDIKARGKWYSLKRGPFPMALGAWYDLRIDARGNQFRCYVNGTLLMKNTADDIPSGSLSIILWEIDGVTPAIAEIGPQKVYRIGN